MISRDKVAANYLEVNDLVVSIKNNVLFAEEIAKAKLDLLSERAKDISSKVLSDVYKVMGFIR